MSVGRSAAGTLDAGHRQEVVAVAWVHSSEEALKVSQRERALQLASISRCCCQMCICSVTDCALCSCIEVPLATP